MLTTLIEELCTKTESDARTGVLGHIAESAQPLIDRTLFRRCGGWLHHDEIADIRSTVLLRLILRLRRRDAPPIADPESFVIALTSNAVNDFLRRRHPERARLKNRLRYLCTVHDDLTLRTVAGIPLCALRAWRLIEVVPAPLDATRREFPDAAYDESDAATAIAAVLRTAGRPVALDDLVTLFHDLWRHGPAVAVDAGHLAVDPAPGAAWTLEQRNSLEALWREIGRLSPQQRAALLLNLRDADGGNALALLLFLQIATFDEVAAAIGISANALAELWSRMPLDDLEIAGRLGLFRQQVINLRKGARRRLERFMKREP